MRAGCLCAAQDLLSRRFGQGNLGVEWDTPCPGSNSRARCAPEGDEMLQQRLHGYGRSKILNCRRSWLTQVLCVLIMRKLVARKKSARRALFPQIVSLHTKRDPGAINGLGPVSIRKIVVWLAQLDTRLRYSNASIDTVICRFTEQEVQEEAPTTFFSIMDATSSSVKPASRRIARECSPSRGGMRRISAGVSEKRAEGRACLILPSLG